MYEPEQIKELFGNEVLTYLTHKNRGGGSGAKGNTYENYFAVYRLALLAQTVVEQNQDIQFSSQITAFVDDLVIDYPNQLRLQHYQLKNSTQVLWGETLGSIADDFQKQYQLNQAISRQSEMFLIISSEALQSKLEQSLPKQLIPYTQVHYFPYASSLIQVVFQEPTFRQAIEYLCAFDHPEPDKIECVATVLLGAWVSSHKSGISIREILTKAQEATPSFIRSFSPTWQLDPEVENILNRITDFTYNLTKGFLHWQFRNGIDQGTLPCSIETEQFKRFQELIKKQQPTTYEELEVFLI